MRVLCVTPYYYPDLGPSVPLVKDLCDGLASRGHDVTVFAAVPHFETGQVPVAFRGRILQESTEGAVRVRRAWVPSGNRKSLLQRAAAFLAYQVITAAAAAVERCDVVLVLNPAIETGLPFAVLSTLRRKPVVFGVWDLYPEAGLALGVLQESSLATTVVRTLEDYCLTRAGLVQALSPAFVPGLLRRGIGAERLELIEPWTDMEFHRPLPRHNTFSREHQLDEAFVVMHAGNIGPSQALEHVIDAADRCRDAGCQFVFVGDGTRRDALVSRAAALTNVKFLPFQPRERLPDVLASCDVALVSTAPGAAAFSIPSKAFGLLATGRPIVAITDRDGPLWRKVEDAGAGMCVEPGAPDAIAAAVLGLRSREDDRSQMGANGRAYALVHHSGQDAIRRMEQALLRVSGAASS